MSCRREERQPQISLCISTLKQSPSLPAGAGTGARQLHHGLSPCLQQLWLQDEGKKKSTSTS